MAGERFPSVVISHDNIDRRVERTQQRLYLLVLGVRGRVGQIARDQHPIGVWIQLSNHFDRRCEPRYRLIVDPVRADVRVAQLDEHGTTILSGRQMADPGAVGISQSPGPEDEDPGLVVRSCARPQRDESA